MKDPVEVAERTMKERIDAAERIMKAHADTAKEDKAMTKKRDDVMRLARPNSILVSDRTMAEDGKQRSKSREVDDNDNDKLASCKKISSDSG